MIISKDILVHHISKYTNIKSTYNLFTTCKDLYKHINEVLNLDDDYIYYEDSNKYPIPIDKRILTLCINESKSINIDINKFRVLESITIILDTTLTKCIDLSSNSIRSVTIINERGTFDNFYKIILDDKVEVLELDSRQICYAHNIEVQDYKLPSNLKSLTLNNFEFKTERYFHDILIQASNKCKRLEYLKLVYNYSISNFNYIFNEFNNLRVLVVYGIKNIQIKDLDNLEELTITNCTNVELNNLKSLKILIFKYKKQIIIEGVVIDNEHIERFNDVSSTILNNIPSLLRIDIEEYNDSNEVSLSHM